MAGGRFRAYWSREAARLKRTNARNWRTFRKQPWQEMSGAFGDLGTFIPIFIALASWSSSSSGSGIGSSDDGLISVPSTLVFSGLANVLTGVYFGIPLPVQPMKAIAAVALAAGNSKGGRSALGPAEVASAGLFVAGAVGALSISGLLHEFTRRVPVPVVKGIQVGAGLTLAMRAIPMLDQRFPDNGPLDYFFAALLYVLLAVLIIAMLAATMSKRLPFTLIVVGGIAALMTVSGIVTLITGYSGAPRLHFGLWDPASDVNVPSGTQFARGALGAGLGQLPLTTLNSVVAVVYLAADLFPELEREGEDEGEGEGALTLPGATSVGVSIAAINLVGCWFGAMPVCHGSGGLAAQYRFGARSGASVIFLGTIKLLLGLFAGQFAHFYCEFFPELLLAVLLFLAGQELVKMGESINGKAARDLWEEEEEEGNNDDVGGVAESGGAGERGAGAEIESVAPAAGRMKHARFREPSDEEKLRRWNIMGATIIGLLGAKNDGIGFIAGIAMHRAYFLYDWWVARQEGQIRLPEQATAPDSSSEL